MQGRILRESQVVRIPIIGNIKVGIKVKRGDKEIPQSLDHFIADGHYRSMFHKEFGDKPKNIEIIFLSDVLEEVCNERLEIRKGAKLYAHGDGKIFKVYNPKTDKYELYSILDYPDIMQKVKAKTGGEWQSILTLRFLIPRIKGIFGVWQLSTKGEKSSIPQIIGSFDQVKNIAGTVLNIPFDLSVEKVRSQKPDSKSLFPVIKLVANVSQPALEKVREFIEHGNKIRGMLTDDRIEEFENIEPKLITTNIKNEDLEIPKCIKDL